MDNKTFTEVLRVYITWICTVERYMFYTNVNMIQSVNFYKGRDDMKKSQLHNNLTMKYNTTERYT